MWSRRTWGTALAILAVVVLAVAIPAFLERREAAKAERAWDARIAQWPEEEASRYLPPPPTVGDLDPEDGALLLLDAYERYEKRWKEDDPCDRLCGDVWDRDGLPAAERARRGAELRALVPDLLPLWDEVVEGSRRPLFFGEPARPRLPERLAKPGTAQELWGFARRLLGLLVQDDATRSSAAAHAAARLAERWPSRSFADGGDREWAWMDVWLDAAARQDFWRIVASRLQHSVEMELLPASDEPAAWGRRLQAAEPGVVAWMGALRAFVPAYCRREVRRAAEDDQALSSWWKTANPLTDRPFRPPEARRQLLEVASGELDWLTDMGDVWDRPRDLIARLESEGVRRPRAVVSSETRLVDHTLETLARLRLARIGLALEAERRAGRAPGPDLPSLARAYPWIPPVNPLTGRPFRMAIQPTRLLLFLDPPDSRHAGLALDAETEAGMQAEGELWIVPRWDVER